jgi:DNA-binding IclR family transcriptional regulator
MTQRYVVVEESDNVVIVSSLGPQGPAGGGGGGGVTDGDKGDITVSGSGTTWTIDPGVVTYAKIQDVSATNKLLGRQSAGAGDVEEITCTSAGRALLDDADASAQRTTLGLGTLATQNGTFSGTSSGTNTGDQNLFSTVAVSGQSDVVADSTSDTLTLVAGTGVSITTSAATDSITINSTVTGLSDGDKGDITVSASGATWTIDNDAVTYAKIQNVSATDKILGRQSAGAGDVEEITCTSAGRALLDDVDASAQRTTLGLGTLATQNGTFSGSSSGTNTGDQNLFSTIVVAGQSNVVADSASDTLTLTAGSGVSITTDASTDTITISATGGGGGSGDVVGPSSATDHALARFDGTTGKLIQNSTGTLSDTGTLDVPNATLDYIQIDTAATPPTIVEGTVSWDVGDGTLDLGLKGGNVNLLVGEQQYSRVYNDTASTMTKGQVVYLSGAQGNRVAVKLARADSETTSKDTIGFVAESIAAGAEGWVISAGPLYNLNTLGLTAGNTVYLSPTTAGAYTTTKPSAPDHGVVLGFVQRVSATVGSFYVKVNNGYEIDELHNVSAVSPSSGNLLIYDAPAGLWEAANLTDGGSINITEGAGSITIAVSDGDKGDITVSASGATWTVDNDAITYAKIQNVSDTDKILGRQSAGTGDVEEIPCTAAGRALLDDADASAQRTTLGLGTLATQSGTFSGTSSGTNTGDQNLFSTIVVSGQSNVVADSTSDTLTLVAGSNVTITTDASTDTITIASTGGGGGGVSDGDKGDITVSSSGAVWTIDNAAVTYAKIQNVTSDRLLGRSTAGAGSAEEISVGSNLVLSGATLSSIQQNAFSTVAVATQSNVVADSPTDTLTLAAGTYISITTSAATDTVTIATSGVQKAITSGTAEPTGGSDGDIYIQYFT